MYKVAHRWEQDFAAVGYTLRTTLGGLFTRLPVVYRMPEAGTIVSEGHWASKRCRH